jgi:hypothetical protein
LKRKRGNVDASHENNERKIKWKVGEDLKEKEIQSASTLFSFSCVNIVLVHEEAEALDVVKSKND